MKPIVIAGNGPSLTKIDYLRLPKDFDVFRCNQFYLEDRYYLGKKIKGVFYTPQVFKEQYFTLHHLQERGEYEAEDIYCNWAFKLDSTNTGDQIENAKLYNFNHSFPHIKNSYEYLEKLPHFLAKDRFLRTFYKQWPTSGIVMLVTAIAQGYKDIYLTGIDLYMGGGVDYAFDVKNKKIVDLISDFKQKDYKSPFHNQEIDRDFIKLALEIKGINIYAISPDSPLCELLPLAPIQQDQEQFQVLSKPEGYICDLVDLPEIQQKQRFEKAKSILIKENLYEQAKRNVFFVLLKDFLFCFKVLLIFIKNIRK